MGYVLFWVIVLGLLLWRKALQDPEWGQKWPDRELADPEREQAVLAAVGPVEGGLAVSVRYVEWSAEQGPGSWRGTRIVVSGACPELTISVGSGSDVDVGDAALDGALSLIGPPLLVRAIMVAPTRKALLDLARSSYVRSGSFRVRDGQVRVDVLRPRSGAIRRMQSPGWRWPWRRACRRPPTCPPGWPPTPARIPSPVSACPT